MSTKNRLKAPQAKLPDPQTGLGNLNLLASASVNNLPIDSSPPDSLSRYLANFPKVQIALDNHNELVNSSLDPIMPVADVCMATSFSQATMYRLIQSGDFPPGIWVTGSRRGWRLSEVKAWIEGRPDVKVTVAA